MWAMLKELWLLLKPCDIFHFSPLGMLRARCLVFRKLVFVDEMAVVEEKSGVIKPCVKLTTLFPITGAETRYTNHEN